MYLLLLHILIVLVCAFHILLRRHRDPVSRLAWLFVVTLLIYLALNLSLSWFARWLSRRTASGGTRTRRKGKGPQQPLDPSQTLLEMKAREADRLAANKGLGPHDGTSH